MGIGEIMHGGRLSRANPGGVPGGQAPQILLRGGRQMHRGSLLDLSLQQNMFNNSTRNGKYK